MTEQSPDADLDIRIVTLHRHWLTADAVKEALKTYGKASEKMEKHGAFSKEFFEFAKMQSLFSVQKVYYALLYVVIEGYTELKLSDKRIDELIADEAKVSLLRRFRNAVFHYQKEPLPEKELDFLNGDYDGAWIREVNKAFNGFFEAYPPIRDFLAEVYKDKSAEKSNEK